MWKSFFAYAPVVILLFAAIASPQLGRNVVGRMNAHELLLALAFVWAAGAILWRVISSVVKAGDAIPHSRESDQEQLAEPTTAPRTLEYASAHHDKTPPGDGTAVTTVFCFLLGIPASGLGLVLVAVSGGVEADFVAGTVLLIVGGVLCSLGMYLKRVSQTPPH